MKNSNTMRYVSIRILAIFVIFLSVAGANTLFAQSQATTGQITGVVSDTTGAIVPNATVTLTSKSTNSTQTATTSNDGIFRFVLLQPGDYSIKASAAGFGEQNLDATVQVGRTVDANFSLGAAGTTSEVTITAEAVQTTTSNFDSVQSETAIQNLPINGRRFQDFVTLTPSAQVDPSRGQISLSGQRGINTNINVDGADYNQPFFGGIRGGERSNLSFTIPQESVREFQVVAAGYSAEFGRSSGGIVNAVTKSGTNNLRGSLFYLYRPEQLARANDYAKALRDQRLSSLGLDATLAPTQHQFGGSVGGPIVNDKLFYFASYEQQRFRAPRQVLYGNLTSVSPGTLNAGQLSVFNYYRSLENQFEQTNDANAALGKIDWNINDANRFNIRYNYSRNNALNAVSTGETALDPTTNRALSTNGTEKNRNNIAVAQLVSTLSSNVINEARYQFAREDRPRLANEETPNVNTSIGEFGTRNFMPTVQYDVRNQVIDSLTYITGNHTLKFGGEFSNIYANQDFGFNQFGVYTFSGLTGTTAVLEALSSNRNLTSGTPSSRVFGRFDNSAARYRQQIGNLSAEYNVQELAFYAQDSWRISPRLTLNYGLRYEKQFNPESEATNTPVLNLIKSTAFPLLGGKSIDPSSIPDSRHQFGPRLGFAYDPTGTGKTVVRGFTGIYYARTPLIGLAAPFNNFRDPAGDLSVELGPGAFTSTGFNQAAFDAANPQYTAIVGNGVAPNTVYRQFAVLGIDLNSKSINGLPTLTPQQLSTIATALRNSTTSPAASLGVYQNANFVGINPEFENPRSFQFGGGVEHQLAEGIVGGIDYSQVNTVHLQRNTDINLPAPTGVDPVTGRVLVNRALRPLTNIGTIQIRDSSARSLYRGLTFRLNVNKKWGRLNAFYTLSKTTSDDDNERDSGGVLYDNPYDLSTEYYLSRIDRRHQFVANPVFFLPYGFEVSSAVRLRSGTPINSTVGSDLNGDGNNNERPILVPGVELKRNFYYNRPLFDVDLRAQKGFNFSERRRLIFSAEFFNILNRSNIQYGGFAVTNFCATSNARCGLDGITNINFLQLRQQNPTSPTFGQINLANNPGSQVFQMQLGARFQF